MSESRTLLRGLVLGVFASFVVVSGWLGWRAAARAPVDGRTGSAGLAVETDAGTGCQYVVTPWGGIFARLGPDGKPLCGANSPRSSG